MFPKRVQFGSNFRSKICHAFGTCICSVQVPLHSGFPLQHVREMCVFHWISQCISLHVFALVLFVCCFAQAYFCSFWVLKPTQIQTQNCIHNGFPFRDVFLSRFVPLWGPFWASKIRPKIAFLALVVHLVALRLHLGDPSLSP